MTDALVTGLGEPVAGVAGARLFPTPQALAKSSEAWYRDVARTGYRGAYIRAISAAVVRGEIDLEALAETSPDVLADDTLEEQLLELPGVGPYAAAHIMMLMGRYSRLILDSATRPKYARLSGRKHRSDAPIVRRFKPYGRFAGLAFWCYVTSDWLDDNVVSELVEGRRRSRRARRDRVRLRRLFAGSFRTTPFARRRGHRRCRSAPECRS